MKASELIKQLNYLTSQHGDLDLNIHVIQYGDNSADSDFYGIDFEFSPRSNYFEAEIEVFN